MYVIIAVIVVGFAFAPDANAQRLITGWHTGNPACPFIPAGPAEVSAQEKDPWAPACCQVPVAIPNAAALDHCENQGWRKVNGMWDKSSTRTR